MRVAGRRAGISRARRAACVVVSAPESIAEEADWLHADRFSSLPPLLAVHLGAGNAAKRWPARAWKVLVERFLANGWRVVVVGGVDDVPLSSVLEPHEWLRDWTGSMTVAQTTALPRAGRPVHRRGLGPCAPGGLGGHALGHPVQRNQPGPAMAAVVAAFAGAAAPRVLPPLSPEGLPAGGPSLHGRSASGPRLPRGDAMVEAHPPGRVAACAVVKGSDRVSRSARGQSRKSVDRRLCTSTCRGLAGLGHPGLGGLLGHAVIATWRCRRAASESWTGSGRAGCMSKAVQRSVRTDLCYRDRTSDRERDRLSGPSRSTARR